jgi:hypothetical protein
MNNDNIVVAINAEMQVDDLIKYSDFVLRITKKLNKAQFLAAVADNDTYPTSGKGVFEAQSIGDHVIVQTSETKFQELPDEDAMYYYKVEPVTLEWLHRRMSLQN